MTFFFAEQERIEKQTLSSAGIIDFQDIPDTFDDLYVLLRVKGTFPGSNNGTMSMRFNNVATQDYRGNLNFLRTDGLLNSGVDSTALTFDLYEFPCGALVQANATVDFTVNELIVPRYRESGRNRHFYTLGGSTFGPEDTVNTTWSFVAAGEMNSTTAVSRIQIGGFVGSGSAQGNLQSGSTATLFGLRNPL